MGDADAGWDWDALHYLPDVPNLIQLPSSELEWAYGGTGAVVVDVDEAAACIIAAPIARPPYLGFASLPVTPPNSETHPSPEPPPRPPSSPRAASVAVSTAFHPDARLLPIPPDVVLVTHDGVLFYAHATKLLSNSANSFNGLLAPNPLSHPHASPTQVSTAGGRLIPLPEHSATLNIVLHCIYDLPCAHYRAPLTTLVAAVDALAGYGASPKAHVAPSRQLFALILAQAPVEPLLAYALAAAHDLLELAVPVSSHTLALTRPLSQALPCALAERIGSVYLRRLFFLHLGRLEALRGLLLPPPHLHPPTASCDFADQKCLTRAWTLASAHLAWEDRPDLSASAIEAALHPLADHLLCRLCKKNLAERVRQLIVRWSMVKRSI